ncbi:MAG TPA: NAD(P)H-hydrate dehydratase [Dehalococcoidia bacterium]|nr:NAD(P)H-hydrate dehydratase [Dehalococcoidia bacterium]
MTAAEMRMLEEQAAAAGKPASVLMENAGLAVANAVREHIGGARARRIVVLIGPGNNGGDGLVAARHLYEFGEDVFVYLLAPRRQPDPNLDALRGLGVEIVDAREPGAQARFDEALSRADLIIDAVLGSGRLRPLEGEIAATFERLKARRAPLFSIDLPTGVDADSGTVDPHAAGADVTFALGFSKVGIHTLPGSSYAGVVEVLDIGLEPGAGDLLSIELLTREWAQAHLPPRPASSNKGTFGRVMVVAGSRQFIGAASLCCLGALRAGAGLVTLAAIDDVRAATASRLPEVTYLPLPEDEGSIAEQAGSVIAREMGRYSALIIGPGLGQEPGTAALVRGLLALPEIASIPVVVDADALNALARWKGWEREIRCKAVLTPHPGELSRLTGESVPDLQGERLEAARRYAKAWDQTLVLKGAHTIISNETGYALVSPFATASLAAAGTGDVLAGVIAGLIAQGLQAWDAAALGVYLHGAAAEWFRGDYGESGLLASELSTGVARVAAELRRSAAESWRPGGARAE